MSGDIRGDRTYETENWKTSTVKPTYVVQDISILHPVMLLRIILFSCILTFIGLPAAAQSTPAKILEQIKTTAQPEKVFIHFDKDHYLAGESVWFKTYLFSGIEVSNNSTAIKIELINSEGRFVAEKILPVFGGIAVGNIDLPVDMPPGNYLFRAYTRWMMNFGSARFYEKNVQIFAPGKLNNASDYAVSFHPEGGKLVEGLFNIVAFKAVDEWKRPVDVNGIIENNKGDSIGAFSSSLNGMGKFRLFAKSGETYIARCKVAGKEKMFDLPAATRGVQLYLEENAKGKQFIVTNNYNQRPAYIIGSIENIFVFESKFPATGQIIKGIIPTAGLPTGILNIGVFDADNRLLAARSTFVKNNDYMINAGLTADTVSTKAHGKNVYTLSVQDSIEGHFSVAVVEDAATISNADNIITRFLLTGDSRFPIHQPQSYFDLPATQQKEALDLLMLTYESKQNNYNEVFSKPPVQIQIKDNNFISLGAIVTTDGKKSLLKNSQLNLLLSTKDSSTNFYSAETDAEGKMYVEGLVFEDTATIFFQNNSKKNKDKAVHIELTSKPVNSLFTAPIDISAWKASTPPMHFTETEIKEYVTKAKNMYRPDASVLEEVKVTATRKSPTQLVEERYATGLFTSQARKTLDFINDPPVEAGGNIFQYLQGKFSYLTVRGSFPDYTVQYRLTRSMKKDPGISDMGYNPQTIVGMTLFLNGTEVDAPIIASIPVRDFAMIKIFSQGFVAAPGNGPGGSLAFFTKTFEDSWVKQSYSNLNSIKLPGFSPVRSFVAPEYKPDSENFNSKDNRTTLYWNPALIINEENRSAKIIFYNPDTVKRYKIIVQGMSADGRLLYIEKAVN